MKPVAFMMSLMLSLVPLASHAAERPINVTTSFSILDDMVQEVGGEHVHVRSLISPEGDAHGYNPRPRDVGAIAQADLVVFNGLQFEGWMSRLLDAAHYRNPVVIASDGITPLKNQEEHDDDDHDHDHDAHEHEAGHEHHHHHGPQDPHAWQDLRNGAQYVRNIRDGLIKVDPAHADDYRQRADAYIARIMTLDGQIRQQMQQLPKDSVVITGHASFNYFANAYGLPFMALQGLSTEDDPSAASVAGLVRTVNEHHVRALFNESMTRSALLNQLSQETRVPIAGTLHSDALAAKGDASTYLGMMQHNADLLYNALHAPAAPRP